MTKARIAIMLSAALAAVIAWLLIREPEPARYPDDVQNLMDRADRWRDDTQRLGNRQSDVPTKLDAEGDAVLSDEAQNVQ